MSLNKTFTGAVENLGGGTAMTFGAISAKSVIANSTNSSAVPAALAGSAAFQYIRVSSDNTTLEWATLSNHASTSIVYNSNTFERAALTGEVTASQNSNTTAIVRSTNFAWTGNHSFGAHFILGTQQNYTGALSTDISLNDTTNRLYILVSGTGEIQTITPVSGTTDIGRIVYVYIVGSGTKTVKHAFSGGGVGRIQCPNNTDFTAENRESFILVGDGANGWLAFCIPADPASVVSDIDSVSVVANGTVLERAALTGAISATQNSNATLFAGIQDNGVAETAQAGLNFANSTSIGFAIAQDGANSRMTVSASRSALTGDVTASANSNTTAFRSFSAKSVLANATNASAVPTEIASSQGLSYLRVNAANTALEWGTITVQSPIAAPGGVIGIDSTVALDNTARIRVSKNSGAIVGTRRELNLIEGSGVSITVADDAGNEEIDITIAATAVGLAANEIEVTATGSINSQAKNPEDGIIMWGGSSSVSCTGVSGTGHARGIPLIMHNQLSSGTLDLLHNTTSSSTNRFYHHASKNIRLGASEAIVYVPTDVTAGATDDKRWLCVSHRWPFHNSSSLSDKDKIAYNSTVGDWDVSQHLMKSSKHCEWWEDFECYEDSNPEINATSIPYQMGNTRWFARSGGASTGDLTFIAGEASHPGILRMSSGATSGTYVCIHRGSSTSTSAWVAGQDILDFEAVVRFVDFGLGNVACSIGFSEDPTRVEITGTNNSHICAFMYDTSNASLNTSLRCVTRESDGTATVTASGVAPTGWARLRILQRTVGTVEFYINDSLVATHTTQVPDTELLNVGLTVMTRTTDIRDLDVDYVGFISQPLSRA